MQQRYTTSVSYYFIFSIFFTFITCHNLLGKNKTKLDGFLRTGVEYEYNDRFSESFYQGKIQYDIEMNENLDAELDIRGESSSQQIELREAYLTAKLDKQMRIDFGQSKIRFGYEFQKSKEKLLTANRTFIYRHMEIFGFVGRDVNFRYYRKATKGKAETEYSLSLNYNEANDLSSVAHWTRPSTIGSFAIGASALIQLDQMDDGKQVVWAIGAELLKPTARHHFEIEGVIGQDPFETEFQKIHVNGRKVYFLGGKFLYGHKMEHNSKFLKAIEPMFVASFLSPDIDDIDRNTIQLLVGVNFYIDKRARIMLNGDFLLSNSPVNSAEDSDERTFFGSNGIVQMELRW